MTSDSCVSTSSHSPVTTPHSVTFDWDGECDIGVVVADAVATVEGTSPTSLPRLFNVVDTDALHRLFDSGRGTERLTEGRVSFPYAGYTVTVHASGQVVVEDEDD